MTTNGPTTKEILLDAAREALGDDALSTIEPKTVKKPTGGASPFKEAPTCMTQRPFPRNLLSGPAELNVGLNAEVPRWVPGSTIKWAAWSRGFDSADDAAFAAEQLQVAAEAWNSHDVGVKFEWVARARDAAFVLSHGGDRGGVLASAYFPNANDLNFVYVYSRAFDPDWRANMWRVFAHELGHVLGLRHEFALEREGNGAVELTPRNEKSVMNYRREPPEIQQSDVDGTKYFYELKKDENGKPPYVGMTQVRDYTPM